MLRSLRDEGLLILEHRGAILDIARHATDVVVGAGVDGAVIGGVAVVLHGYIRTTLDVDLFVARPDPDLKRILTRSGFSFHRHRREFSRDKVPLHIVTLENTRLAPTEFMDLEGIRTVSLPDLINLKLTSGLRDPLRAIDIADVIGLIRCRRLTPAFSTRLVKTVRPEFRRLARAVARRSQGSTSDPRGICRL